MTAFSWPMKQTAFLSLSLATNTPLARILDRSLKGDTVVLTGITLLRPNLLKQDLEPDEVCENPQVASKVLRNR